MKIKKEELIHIIIIVVGTLFLLISAIPKNIPIIKVIIEKRKNNIK